MKNAIALAIVVLVVLLAVWWSTMRAPAPAPTNTTPAHVAVAPAPIAAEFGSCDQQPRPPALPEQLSPASADLAGIVVALDAALNDQHKAWLRCFTTDTELLARTQRGMGRWLRNTLHLTQAAPLRRALGAKAPDEASSIIILAYVAHLRGQELSTSEAAKRRAAALADAGVTP